MAKVSAVEKNKKRIKLAKKYEAKRKKLKKMTKWRRYTTNINQKKNLK